MRDRVLSYGCLACGGVGGDHHALSAFDAVHCHFLEGVELEREFLSGWRVAPRGAFVPGWGDPFLPTAVLVTVVYNLQRLGLGLWLHDHRGGLGTGRGREWLSEWLRWASGDRLGGL